MSDRSVRRAHFVVAIVTACFVTFTLFGPVEALFHNGPRSNLGDFFRGLVALVGESAARLMVAALQVAFGWVLLAQWGPVRPQASSKESQGANAESIKVARSRRRKLQKRR